MTNRAYEDAKQLMYSNKDLMHFYGPVSDNVIRDAEICLNVVFSGSYLQFLKEFGSGEFGSICFFGVRGDRLTSSYVLSVVRYNTECRNQGLVPRHMLMFSNDTDDANYSLDYREKDNQGEVPVVEWNFGYAHDKKCKTLADSFGAYLFMVVEEVLTNNGRSISS